MLIISIFILMENALFIICSGGKGKEVKKKAQNEKILHSEFWDDGIVILLSKDLNYYYVYYQTFLQGYIPIFFLFILFLLELLLLYLYLYKVVL